MIISMITSRAYFLQSSPSPHGNRLARVLPLLLNRPHTASLPSPQPLPPLALRSPSRRICSAAVGKPIPSSTSPPVFLRSPNPCYTLVTPPRVDLRTPGAQRSTPTTPIPSTARLTTAASIVINPAPPSSLIWALGEHHPDLYFLLR